MRRCKMDIRAGLSLLNSTRLHKFTYPSICNCSSKQDPNKNSDGKDLSQICNFSNSVNRIYYSRIGIWLYGFVYISIISAAMLFMPMRFTALPSGDKFSTDWDKAWTNFRKKGKKTLFSQFSPNKYVTWNPRRSNYPISEEIDPIKKTERSNLELWTGPRFTLVVATLIVLVLLLYTILSPIK